MLAYVYFLVIYYNIDMNYNKKIEEMMVMSPKLTVGEVIKSKKEGISKRAPKNSKETLEKAKANRAKRHLYRGILST